MRSGSRSRIGDHVRIGVGSNVLKYYNIAKDSIITSLSVIPAGVYYKSLMKW